MARFVTRAAVGSDAGDGDAELTSDLECCAVSQFDTADAHRGFSACALGAPRRVGCCKLSSGDEERRTFSMTRDLTPSLDRQKAPSRLCCQPSFG